MATNVIVGGVKAEATYAPAANITYLNIPETGMTVQIPISVVQMSLTASQSGITTQDPRYQDLMNIANDTTGQQGAIAVASAQYKSSIKLPTSANSPTDESQTGKSKTNTTNQAIGTQTVITPIGESAYPNILHNYSTYTYNLSLHVISIKQYNAFSNAKTDYTPEDGAVLIASAGRWDNTPKRNKNFNNADFFFEKMSFETVIGSVEYAQNSNVLSLDFTIIEPYGMTLINRLLDLAKDYSVDPNNKSVQSNVLQLPYLLQIDFFGYEPDGKPQKIDSITKYIPIMLTGVKFKVSTTGSEYSFTAVPYNHQAFTDTNGSTPAKVQVSANSLKEFFATDKTKGEVNQTDLKTESTITNAEDIKKAKIKRETLEKASAGLAASGAGTRTGAAEVSRAAQESNIQPVPFRDKEGNNISQKSYTEAVNLWHKVNKEIGVCEIPDEIAFTLSNEFIDAKFQPKELINITSLAMAEHNTEQANLAIQSGMVTNIDDKEHPVVVTTINQGTSILNVIRTAMLNSDYIHNQIIDPSKDTDITVGKMREFLQKPLNWFHVVPSVEILGYDTINNRYAKRITYNIQHKKLYQDKNRNASQGKPITIAKDYEYIFTGKNNDILHFDLDFNSQFYVVNVANPSNMDATSAATAADLTPSQSLLDQEDTVKLTKAQVAAILNDINANGVPELKPKVHLVSSLPTNSITRGGKAEMAKQLDRNILSTIAGDMVSVSLRIIGDPDFIKQDDVFYGIKDITEQTYTNIANKRVTDKRRTPNKSIATDSEDLFVRLVFKTAVDYGDNGLAVPVSIDSSAKNRYASSIFSGLYKITTVKNYFSNGKFEQELNLYHYNLQATPGINTGTDKQQREDDKNATKSTVTGPIIGIPATTTDVQGTPAATRVIR